MKNFLSMCIVLLLLNAQVSQALGTLEVPMTVSEAKKSFADVSGALLMLSKSSASTKIVLTLTYSDRTIPYSLKVLREFKDQSGCTNFHTKLDKAEQEDNTSGYWFFVDIIDYSSCSADGIWQAKVKSGCRCCGEDSTMILTGGP